MFPGGLGQAAGRFFGHILCCDIMAPQDLVEKGVETVEKRVCAARRVGYRVTAADAGQPGCRAALRGYRVADW